MSARVKQRVAIDTVATAGDQVGSLARHSEPDLGIIRDQCATKSTMNNPELNRRHFLKGAVSFGLAGTALWSATQSAAGASASDERLNIIGPRDGFSPQIGTLVSMLDWMRATILGPVQGLTVAQLDYLVDPKANTIGALLLHLAATERFYQIHSFDGKALGDFDEETRARWGAASALGAEGRKKIKGHKLAFYLDTLAEVREKTRAELRKRDDAWLMEVDQSWPWGPTNNYCKWFHVCEHESNHNGQVKWIKGRLAGASR